MMSNRVWIIATAILSIAAIALGWVLGISPKLNEEELTNSQAAAVEASNMQLDVELAALKALYGDIEKIRADLDDLRQVLPPDAAYANFYRLANDLAIGSGVSVAAATAGTPAVFQGATAPVAAPVTEEAPAGDEAEPAETPAPEVAAADQAPQAGSFYSIPITLTVDGAMEGVWSYLAGLQGDGRLFLVTGVTITGLDGGVTSTINGMIFVLIDPTYVPPVEGDINGDGIIDEADSVPVEEAVTDEEAGTEPTPTPTPTP